jgi:hypothetical protein
MTSDYYKIALTDRRRMLADAGFVRDDLRIWSHADGRAIGEGVAAALTDEAFLRFLKVGSVKLPQLGETTAEAEDSDTRTNILGY